MVILSTTYFTIRRLGELVKLTFTFDIFRAFTVTMIDFFFIVYRKPYDTDMIHDILSRQK